MGRKCVIWLILLKTAFEVCCGDVALAGSALSREERSLVYGDDGQIQVTAGFDLPTMVNNVTVTVSLSTQATYGLPTNASEFTSYATSSSRSLRSYRSPWTVTRAQVYSYLEQVLEDSGFSGHDCLLWSVCDAARVPLHTAAPGMLLEEILHIVLTPSEGAVETDDGAVGAYDDFLDAEARGRSGGDCASLFPGCAASPLDLLSEMVF